MIREVWAALDYIMHPTHCDMKTQCRGFSKDVAKCVNCGTYENGRMCEEWKPDNERKN